MLYRDNGEEEKSGNYYQGSRFYSSYWWLAGNGGIDPYCCPNIAIPVPHIP